MAIPPFFILQNPQGGCAAFFSILSDSFFDGKYCYANG